MMGTYASAALICVASLVIGRAVLVLSGQSLWSWIEPSVGFGVMLGVAGALARAPGHAMTATIGLAILLIAAVSIVGLRPQAAKHWKHGLPVAAVLALMLSIPFVAHGGWRLLGGNLADGIDLHVGWAEWLRDGSGAAPQGGHPLGPHGLADAVAVLPGIDLKQAFDGELFAIAVVTGLTALVAIGHLGPVRRTLGASLVALPYLAAVYIVQGAFKQAFEAMFVLATAVAMLDFERSRLRAIAAGGEARTTSQARRRRDALVTAAIAAGIFFSNSFAGLLWPLAIVGRWSLNRPEVRARLRPGSLRRLAGEPLAAGGLAVLAALCVLAATVGPFSVNLTAPGDTTGRASAIAAFGIWPTGSYNLDAPGGAHLTGLVGAVSVAAIAIGLLWWLRRREAAVPVAFGVSSVIYLLSPLFRSDFASTQALMIVAPLAMLVSVRPLLEETGPAPTPLRRGRPPAKDRPWAPLRRWAWWAFAVVFIGGAVYSSFLALRSAPVADEAAGSPESHLVSGPPAESWTVYIVVDKHHILRRR